MESPSLFLTGGGTAGHVYPALAIAEEILKRNPNVRLFWIGRPDSFEQELVKSSPLGDQITFLGISSGKLRRYFSLQNFTDLFRVFAGFWQSLFYAIRYRPRLIFSKGGFVTVPVVLGAWCARIPVISHESDFDLGLATRINACFSHQIFLSFEETKRYFRNPSRLQVMGNPIRPELLRTTPATRAAWREGLGIPHDLPLIFVIGGSLGAEQINALITELKDALQDKAFILHQTGKGMAPSRGEQYLSTPFLELTEMAEALGSADIVISRSGAGSLSEFATLGKAMILVPLQVGSRGDQLHNSLYFKRHGAALLLEKDGNAQRLLELIQPLLDDPVQRQALGDRAQELARPQAARSCAEVIVRDFL